MPAGTYIVSDPQAAAFLSDPERSFYLGPFLDREVALTEVAQELQLPLGRMHYWVTRLLALGLIRVSRVQQRPGRPVRYYRSIAPAFFLPFAATPAETLEAQLVREGITYQRRMSGAQARASGDLPRDHGTLITRTGVDGHGIRAQPFPERNTDTPVFSTWLERPYRDADAQALLAELQALAERYSTLPEPEEGEGRVFYLRLALAPL